MSTAVERVARSRTRPSILQVEDDLSLADAVRMTFESLGFAGTFRAVPSVHEALHLLDELVTRGEPPDLLLTDMRLPDGTGLDVVRGVRANPALGCLPVLMLSNESDDAIIGRAYALGANCFISKSSRGRSIIATLRTLYEHWLRDAHLPTRAAHLDDMHLTLARAVRNRARHADIYMRIAEHRLREDDEAGAFWLERGLSQSNLENLLSFVARQLDSRALRSGLFDDLDRQQTATEATLGEIERYLDALPATEPMAQRWMLDLIEAVHRDTLARALGELFPLASVAAASLRDAFAADLEASITWVDTRSEDPRLRTRAAAMKGELAQLRGVRPQR